MRLEILIFLFIAAIAKANPNLNVVSQENIASAPLPSNGAPVDEVIVESSLYIKPKPKANTRRAREVLLRHFDKLPNFSRDKRAPLPRRKQNNLQEPEYAQSQAASNAAANANFNTPTEYGASAANAQAQAFNSLGAAGSFGASSAGTQTQAQQGNKLNGAFQNSAAASMSQVYTLPNGQTINFASTNSFANNANNFGSNANSRGSAVSVSGK